MKGENGKEERFWQQKKKKRKSENQDWTRKERKNSQSSRQLACITMKHPLQSSHQMPSSWPFLIFTHLYTEHYTTREILMFMLRFLLQGKTQQDLVITIAPLPSPVSGTEKVPTKYAPEEKNTKKKKKTAVLSQNIILDADSLMCIRATKWSQRRDIKASWIVVKYHFSLCLAYIHCLIHMV